MTDEIPFVDLQRQWRQIADDCLPEIARLIERSQFSLGPAVEAFEREFADYVGAKHAVGVNSGTSALHLGLMAAGIGRGDRVLLPSHTFIATAWAPLYVGAEPILCDVDLETGTIDVQDAEARMQPGVKAIMPVHLYGQPADIDGILAFAERHKLVVIEDACQAHGARYRRRHVGTFGKAGCFSFYPGKNLGAPGEAGMLVTDDDALADKVRMLRNHGQAERYVHSAIGYNYRMEGINGLVLSHKLRRLDAWTDQRREVARLYAEGLSGLPLQLPVMRNQDHVYHLYVVRTQRREELRAHLSKLGVATGLHYPVPLHRQPCLQHLPRASSGLPNSEYWANEGLSLPMFPGMTKAEVTTVVEAVTAFFDRLA